MRSAHTSGSSAKRSIVRILVGVALIALLLPVMGNVGAAGEEGPLLPRWSGTGNYGIAAWGVGTLATGEGEFSLTVPGTSVVQAYLYWSLLDTTGGGGDDAITLTVDPAVGTPTPLNVVADETYGPTFWGLVGDFTVGDHFVYVADITAQVQTGTHVYRVADMDPVLERYGAGIVAVYEDATLPEATVDLRDGLDSLYWNWTPPTGPNSLVNCVQFAPSTEERIMNFAFLGAGVTIEPAGGDRPDALWAVTGNGTPPTELINPPAPGRVQINHQSDSYPFDSHVGPQFDVLLATETANNIRGTQGVVINPNDTYACFQVESVSDIPDGAGGTLDGASMIWLALATALNTPQQQIPAALGDYVWLDQNNNGAQDAGEPGVPGVTVNLYAAGTTTPLATTTTDASGLYLFSNLQPGDYFVEFVKPAGYNFTTRDMGGDAMDSDADPTTGRTTNITLPAGMTDLTWDAGLVQPPQLSALGDYVWLDQNNNGVQDAGEPGVSGVTVNLYTATGTFVASTTTDASGLYLFADLQPGDYQVEFVRPAGYDFTTRDAGGDAADSDADLTTGRTVAITLPAGVTDLTWDAGLVAQVPTATPTLGPTVTPTQGPTATPTSVEPYVCFDIPSVGGVGAGSIVTYTITFRNLGGAPLDPAVMQQTINTNVFTSIVDVTTTQGQATIQGTTVVLNFGALAPSGPIVVVLRLQADPNLGAGVFNPDPFITPSTLLDRCPQAQPTATPSGSGGGDNTPVPTVDIGQITSLPNTGYPPVSEAPQSRGIDFGGLALAAVAMTLVGGVLLTRRGKGR